MNDQHLTLNGDTQINAGQATKHRLTHTMQCLDRVPLIGLIVNFVPSDWSDRVTQYSLKLLLPKMSPQHKDI